MDWIFANWEWIMLIFYVAEKIVKLTKWPYDDIIIDIIGAAIGRLATKKKE